MAAMSRYAQDLDGKERVEIVRQVVVEKGKNVAGESDHLLESLREKTVVKYIEHRCMRYFYDDGEDKYLLLRQATLLFMDPFYVHRSICVQRIRRWCYVYYLA